MSRANMTAATPIELLRGLASGLCHDASLSVEEAPGNNWAYDPDRNVILVGAADLRRKGVLPCAAILAHEASHFHISRYNMYRFSHPSVPLLKGMLNALEDPRVNLWIQRRYPGTRRWFQALVAAEGFLRCTIHGPEHHVFGLRNCAEALIGWDTSRLPVIRSARLAAALSETAAARRAFSEILPGHNPPGNDPARAPGIEFMGEVAPMMAVPVPRELTCREEEVHIAQARAVRLAIAEIIPAFTRLLEADIARLAQAMTREHGLIEMAEAALACKGNPILSRTVISMGLGLCPDPDPLASVTERLQAMALRLFEGACAGQELAGAGQRACASPRPATHRGRSSASSESTGAGLTVSSPTTSVDGCTADYDSTRVRMEPQICRLVRGIEEALIPRRRLREERGHASGFRLDMRAVTRFEADPRRYERLWCRRNIPNRRELAVSLLVDLSGSMTSGGKLEAAFAGTVLLVEMLHRLGVPFAVNGFQDTLIPFCALGEGFTPGMASKLAWMPAEAGGKRPGGNNCPGINDDGPCLLAAARQLQEWPATHRLLLCVSDGEPAGPGNVREKLLQAVGTLSANPGMAVVGLGLGADTGHVAQYYPRHIANVPENQFADRIGSVLIDALMAL